MIGGKFVGLEGVKVVRSFRNRNKKGIKRIRFEEGDGYRFRMFCGEKRLVGRWK